MEKSVKSNKSKGKIILAVGAVLVIALGGFGVKYYVDQKNYVSTDDAKITGDILNVGSKLPGKVLKINTTVGANVKKGDVLFTLEADQLQYQLNQAQAALDVAKAQLTKVESGARAQEVAGAQSMVDQATASLNGANTSKSNLQGTLNTLQSEYNKLVSQMDSFKDPSTGDYDASYAMKQLDTARAKNLLTEAQYTVKAQAVEQLFSSKTQLENQISQLQGQIKAIDAQISAAKAGLEGANSKLSLTNSGASDKDVAIVEAQVRAAQAAFDLAKLNFENSEIKAAQDGTVVQVNIHEGDMIAAGQAAISVVDLGKLQVTANVLESDLERISANEKVTMSVDAYPGVTFTGTVKETGLATTSTFSLFSTENASGNFTKVSQRVPVKITLDSNGKAVIPGMSVETKIKTTK
ncbi:HlyD family secretion protein [Clostridium fungisolvens]|uniref:Colistin resistance protein EmrA n=1 Tax=Clostridium fungisolvens TaxID=1604897 RepID=A0A6V8SHL5_9CLOT|nr:HlyD family secretion protein [Clostridium fungisolvens]GFP76226.1 Colistin resistance protein EmrA [Clostridium fungisolvens]